MIVFLFDTTLPPLDDDETDFDDDGREGDINDDNDDYNDKDNDDDRDVLVIPHHLATSDARRLGDLTQSLAF